MAHHLSKDVARKYHGKDSCRPTAPGNIPKFVFASEVRVLLAPIMS
jgi:hypothetical protein